MVCHTVLPEALVLLGGIQRDVHSRLLLSAVVLNIQNCSLLSYVKHSHSVLGRLRGEGKFMLSSSTAFVVIIGTTDAQKSMASLTAWQSA